MTNTAADGRPQRRRVLLRRAAAAVAAGLGVLVAATMLQLEPVPDNLSLDGARVDKYQVLDRDGQPLTVTYRNRWNLHNEVSLHQVPRLLQQAFVISEDQRFFEHAGADWRARGRAVWQNLRAGRAVRGASTITEQVVRMLHPRPRTLWSRWLEAFEAAKLESRVPKAEILEFYLNQVPYGAQRRGVEQAAHYYFSRGLDTLSHREMLALVVLVRAPSAFDPYRDPGKVDGPIERLAARLLQRGAITEEQHAQIRSERLALRPPAELPVRAEQFVHHVYGDRPVGAHATALRTTLDARIQRAARSALDARLHDLRGQNVHHGAVFVVDHHTDEILAWVNAQSADETGPGIDAVTTPRQPGSTLKPFLYALALEKGWTAATLIDDVPLAESVGLGLHAFQNYSRTYYGPLRLRDALGNSLNIPAVRTVQFTGRGAFLERLRALGIDSLRQHPDFYGDGIALGNGEVTLYELVRAYAVLARQGVYRPLRSHWQDGRSGGATQVFSADVASLVANILSDPDARALEFGRSGLLRFPVETAIKTGTSSDFRDAWAIGFDHRHTVGVWMGNLDYRSTDGVSGAIGPALVLRAVFAELNRFTDTLPLYLSPRLVQAQICRDTGALARASADRAPVSPTEDVGAAADGGIGQADGQCASRPEWFVAHTVPRHRLQEAAPARPPSVRLQHPTPGLLLAMDPRIADEKEAFRMALTPGLETEKVEWWIDGSLSATTEGNHNEYVWPLRRGRHEVKVRVWLRGEGRPHESPAVAFAVK